MELPRDEGGGAQMLVSKEELAQPLQDLPPVQFAFAYGSGVFRQHQSSSERMIDYIFGVSSPAVWHSHNIEMNPQHYSSWLSCFGGKPVADAARIIGVGVHFNPFVQWHDKVIKYGVVGISDVIDDIQTWKRLYISGRLQKPVCMLSDDSNIAKENEANLRSALAAAMLLLPREFSEQELYETICGLSYQGDIRLLFAEDKEKVPKIVRGSFINFRSLYDSSIHHATSKNLLSSRSQSFVQDTSPDTVRALVSQLPVTLLDRLAAKTGAPGNAVADVLVKHGIKERQRLVRRALAGIVRTSSIRQALSGFFAAGGINAAKYVSSKIAKARHSTK